MQKQNQGFTGRAAARQGAAPCIDLHRLRTPEATAALMSPPDFKIPTHPRPRPRPRWGTAHHLRRLDPGFCPEAGRRITAHARAHPQEHRPAAL